MTETFVLIGMAGSRTPWFSELARWSTSGLAPIEFLKCLSADEARAVLASGRRVSALLVDAGGPALDRDLVALAEEASVATIVVTGRGVHRDWDALGCAALLPEHFDRDTLVETLTRHAAPVDRSRRRPGRVSFDGPVAASGSVVAVLGAGGSGVSTIAMAAAQAAGGRPGSPTVALIDGSRRGDLAMYHDVGDVIPGLPELVEGHRSDNLDPDEVRSLLFRIDERRYDLLLGLRRPSDWVTLKRRSVAAAIDSLRRSYELIVADTDHEMEGEHETGSVDIADRHAVTSELVAVADVVVVVSRPDLKGLHDLARLSDELSEHAVPRHRVLHVINQCPRRQAMRAGLTRNVTELLADPDRDAPGPVVVLPRVRWLDDVHHRATRLPSAMCRSIGESIDSLLESAGPRPQVPAHAQPIVPGELGTQAVTHDTSDVA